MGNEQKVEEDEVLVLLQFDLEKKNIVLQVSCNSEISPEEFLNCLIDFIDDNEKNVDGIFKDVDNCSIKKH